MTGSIAGRRFTLISRVVPILLILVLAAAAVGLFNSATFEGSLEATLLRDLSEPRVGGGRFFRAPALAYENTHYRKAAARAEVALLTIPNSATKQRIQALVDAGNGNLQRSTRTLQTLHEADPRNVELLNDLGV